MIVLAWFPPIWRRVMDHRLLDHFEGDVTQANINPRKREKILARYGAGGGAAGAGRATTTGATV
jgi:alkane 1-monooxygenase